VASTQKVKENPNAMVESCPVGVGVVTLTAGPLRVDTRKNLEVEWNHSAESTNKDWIGLYKIGSDHTNYTTYEMVKGGKRTGSLSFVAPDEYGLYEFRYISNNYQLFGTSNKIRVGPSFQLNKTVLAERQVQIEVQKLEGSDPIDYAWIAVYPSKSSTYLEYQWAKESRFTFNLPKAGLYQFKLFGMKSLHSLAATIDHTVQGSDSLKLKFTDNSTFIEFDLTTVDVNCDKVWVGLYLQNETDQKQWRFCKWLYENKGTVTLRRPTVGGSYEARLFAYGTHDVVVKSSPCSL